MLTPYFIYFVANTASVSVLIFIPLIAKDYGANSETIGVLVALYNGMIFLSSAIFGRLADLKGGKFFIIIGLLISSGIFFGHIFASNIHLLFIIRCVAGLAVGMFPAPIIAYMYKKTNNLGFLAAVGSLGWGIGSIVAGIILEYQKIFIFAGIAFIFIFFVAVLFLNQEYTTIKQHFFNVKILKKNWRVYVMFLLRHSGAGNIWVIYPLFLSHLGASKFWIGVIYAINSFAQVFFMPILGNVKSEKLINMGLFFSTITFIGFAICRNFYQIMPIQLILAFSWSSLYIGALKYLMENNEEHSTVVGIFNSIMSVAAIVGAIIGGVVNVFGYPAVMYTAAIFTIIGAIVFLIKR